MSSGFMFEPTRAQLLEAIEPLVDAVKSPDQVSVKVGIVLAALAGCLVEPIEPADLAALDALARAAGLVCEHRAGWH